MHELQHGPASRSYGVQVARLAGMPHTLIRQARTTLESLEAQQKQADEQIDLFAQAGDLAAAAAQSSSLVMPDVTMDEAMSASEAQTLALLSSIDPDTLTPREALDALYKLKAVISS